MGMNIRKAQEGIVGFVRQMSFGELMLVLAPMFMCIEGIEKILSLFSINTWTFIDIIFSINYYLFLLSVPLCFATNKSILVTVVYGLYSAASFATVIRSLQHDYFSFTYVVSVLGYAFLAYIFYVLHVKATEN